MNLEDKIKSLLKQRPIYGKDGKSVCTALHLNAKKYSRTARLLLNDMEKRGDIIFSPSGYGFHPSSLHPFKATVSGTKRGFAFLVPQDPEEHDSDEHCPKDYLNGAYDKDVVLCAMDPEVHEAFVIKILSRGNKTICGCFDVTKGHKNIVIPDNEKFASDIYIPNAETMGALPGDKVVCEIVSYAANKLPEGKITEILGKEGNLFTEELAVIREYELREEFPEDVINEAAKAAKQEIYVGDRKDLRDLFTITIDGVDTRDMDDAVSIKKEGSKYVLGVHIADVTHYVKASSKTDLEAYERGTSVYFPDRVFPMLPVSLSNGACSLNENEDRYALSCMMTFNKKGTMLSYEIFESVIRSNRRMNYPDINKILDGDEELCEKYKDVINCARDMCELRDILKARREENGEINLDVKEAKIYCVDDKIEIPDYERGASEDIIEQFMIAANEAVALFAQKHNLPILYRVHEPPSKEKADFFVNFVRDFGLKVKFDTDDTKPQDFASVLKLAEGIPEEGIVNKVMLRSMQKARYCEKNLGHFGLASENYCHFTSPIRRYPDLFTHRTIKAFLHGKAADIKGYADAAKPTADHASECERRADECERDVDSLYMCYYMEEHIGEEYYGVVSGVTSFAIFVELKNSVEGTIRLEDLPEDDYKYFEEKLRLVGRRHSYRLGDEIKIKVKDCNYLSRKIYFSQVL